MLIQVIIGSVRKGRIGDQVANWVLDLLKQKTNHTVELVDLADWHLPMNDEPNLPSSGIYIQEHTKAWSKKIASADAYVFVCSQYNHGYAASLKNALDHLYKEWHNKSATIVCYGFSGAEKVADQLKQVFNILKLNHTTNFGKVMLSKDIYNQEGRIANPDASFAAYKDSVEKSLDELLKLITA